MLLFMADQTFGFTELQASQGKHHPNWLKMK
jgi:hypothetical protein